MREQPARHKGGPASTTTARNCATTKIISCGDFDGSGCRSTSTFGTSPFRLGTRSDSENRQTVFRMLKVARFIFGGSRFCRRIVTFLPATQTLRIGTEIVPMEKPPGRTALGPT